MIQSAINYDSLYLVCKGQPLIHNFIELCSPFNSPFNNRFDQQMIQILKNVMVLLKGIGNLELCRCCINKRSDMCSGSPPSMYKHSLHTVWVWVEPCYHSAYMYVTCRFDMLSGKAKLVSHIESSESEKTAFHSMAQWHSVFATISVLFFFRGYQQWQAELN